MSTDDHDDEAFFATVEADRRRARQLAADVLEQAMATGRVPDHQVGTLQTESDRVCGEYYLLIRDLRGA